MDPNVGMTPASSYRLTQNDYVSGYSGVPVQATPFYIELVDDLGNLQALYSDSASQVFAVKMNINPMSISINMSKIVNRTRP